MYCTSLDTAFGTEHITATQAGWQANVRGGLGHSSEMRIVCVPVLRPGPGPSLAREVFGDEGDNADKHAGGTAAEHQILLHG